jgi:hypothetical protein
MNLYDVAIGEKGAEEIIIINWRRRFKNKS